jgi:hypothetical protein
MQEEIYDESSVIVAKSRWYISVVSSNIGFIFWKKIISVLPQYMELQYNLASMHYRKQSTCCGIIYDLREWN